MLTELSKQFSVSTAGACFRLSCTLLLALLATTPAANAEVVCVEVKIEIRQKLNVERQGFTAMLRINNGLDSTTLTNVGVNVKFADRNGVAVRATTDPNDTSATFFLRENPAVGIAGGVQGAGSVLPKTTGEATWLIIPTPGAGGLTPAGEVYLVGATLTYNEGSESRRLEVTPDTIVVAPQPKLELDYFLPREVYADDPFTDPVEPVEPFTLGLRVSNAGAGPAASVTIESAQPKIVENLRGLLVGFQIDGAYLQDEPADSSLLMNFGSIDPTRAKVGRWVMTTTLSGRFVEFGAEITHADSLGGAVTSLIQRITTHTLLKDVRVDLPGRDPVRDFLARDGDVIRVYENEGSDAIAVDQSGTAQLTAVAGGGFDLAFAPLPGAVYARVGDPSNGQFAIGRVERSDGKVLPPENAWKSRERNAAGSGWIHYLNVFDLSGTGRYRLAAATSSSPTSLAGSVYLDTDNDGRRDATEIGLSGVVITLNGSSAAGETVRQFASSDATGAFSFRDVPAGTYSIADGIIDQTTEGIHGVGSAGGQVGIDRITNIVLSAGTAANAYAFAKRPTAPSPQADLAVSVAFADARIGEGRFTAATITVQNLGPAAADAVVGWQLPASLHLLLASSETGTVGSELSTWRVPSLAAGGSATLRLDVRADEPGTALLRASVATNAQDISTENNSASASVDVGDKPAASQELNLLPRVLALVSCRTASGVDPVCTNARASRLSAMLAELGIEHTVVTDTLVYREALRSGRYNVHWISGGAAPMADQLAEELRNALRRGDGVLVDGAHDTRSAVIDAVAAVTYVGALPGAAPAFTTDASVFDAGLTLTPSGAGFSIDTVGGVVAATFAGGGEAIVAKQFGDGRALTFAFELADSAATAQANRNAWLTLVENALIWLTREPAATAVGREFVPLSTRLTNPLDTPVTVEVAMTADAGIQLATTNLAFAAGATAASPRWSITLSAGATRWLETGFRVPAQTVSTGVNTVVTWVKSGGSETILSTRQTLSVTAAETRFGTVLAELRALSLSDPAQIALRDTAIAALERARVSVNGRLPAAAVVDLIAAEQALQSLVANQPGVRVDEVSRLVEEAGLLWQALNPICGSATASGLTLHASTFWPFATHEGLEIRGGAPGAAEWEWGVGTNTNSPQHSVRYSTLDWVSGKRYAWKLAYGPNGSATLTVGDGTATFFSQTFVPSAAPGMRSGNAVQLTATLNNSAPRTPISATIDRVNGAPAAAVLNVGTAPQADGSTVVYYPAMTAGMSVEGTLQIDFTGTAPPEKSKLDLLIHAGQVACRPEFAP